MNDQDPFFHSFLPDGNHDRSAHSPHDFVFRYDRRNEGAETLQGLLTRQPIVDSLLSQSHQLAANTDGRTSQDLIEQYHQNLSFQYRSLLEGSTAATTSLLRSLRSSAAPHRGNRRRSRLDLQQRRFLMRDARKVSADPSVSAAHNSAASHRHMQSIRTGEDEKKQSTAQLATVEDEDFSVNNSQWSSAILKESKDMIYVLSAQGKILYVSPSSFSLLGFSPEEMLSKDLKDFLHPSDAPIVKRKLRESASKVKPNKFSKTQANQSSIHGTKGRGDQELSLLMRVQSKFVGFRWIESHGVLVVDRYKSRKIFILAGRERLIYDLNWTVVKQSLQARSPGLWLKLSSDGLILHLFGRQFNLLQFSSGVGRLLVHGQHMNELLTPESLQVLRTAMRSGGPSTVVHTIASGKSDPFFASSTICSSLSPNIPFVFAYVTPMSNRDGDKLRPNILSSLHDDVLHYPSEAEAMSLPNDLGAASSSLFGEMSLVSLPIWEIKLENLKRENRRLQQTIERHCIFLLSNSSSNFESSLPDQNAENVLSFVQ